MNAHVKVNARIWTPALLSSTMSTCNDSGERQKRAHQGQTIIKRKKNTSPCEESPLHLASRFNRASVVQSLLKTGEDPNAVDVIGRTPLHLAVASDAQDVIHILLNDCRTNLNACMKDGGTPLIIAARLDIQVAVEELLLKGSVDINAADRKGV